MFNRKETQSIIFSILKQYDEEYSSSDQKSLEDYFKQVCWIWKKRTVDDIELIVRKFTQPLHYNRGENLNVIA